MKHIRMLAAFCLTAAAVLPLSGCLTAGDGGAADEIPVTQAITEAETVTEPYEPPESALDSMVAHMSVEEKVGQLFFTAVPEEGAVEGIAQYHPGGYLLFGYNIEGKTAEELSEETALWQESAPYGLLIGVDEEGGDVVRVSDNPSLRDSAFLSPRDTYAAGGWEQVEQTETEKAQLLRSLGINTNFAPVCDITASEDSFMYSRSFSGDVDEVVQFAETAVTAASEQQVGTVLKHFPGYGDNADTHDGMAYDERAYAEYTNRDFKPFEAGISSGADCILVGHIVVDSMDSEYPASLSDKVHQILREDLSYHGVIITDDLAMDAITQYAGSEDAAVLAIQSGNDMICCSDIAQRYPAVLEAVENEQIPMQRIDASVKRILQWKQKLGVLDPTQIPTQANTTEEP